MMAKLRAFTLIELLVVIAIIAILAAILFPVFARARAQSYAASCTSNQNQEIKAFIMYADDNGNKAVLTWYPGSNAVDFAPGCMRPSKPGYAWQPCDVQVPGWGYLLDTYRKSFDILKCASAGNDWGIYGSTLYDWWFNWCRFSQHGYSWAYFCPTPVGRSPGEQWPRKLTMFQVPADTIVFCDDRINTGSASAPIWKKGFNAVDPPTCGECEATGSTYWWGGWPVVSPDARHSDKINVTMLDSHVKRYSIDYIGYDQRWDFTDN